MSSMLSVKNNIIRVVWIIIIGRGQYLFFKQSGKFFFLMVSSTLRINMIRVVNVKMLKLQSLWTFKIIFCVLYYQCHDTIVTNIQLLYPLFLPTTTSPPSASVLLPQSVWTLCMCNKYKIANLA